LFGSQPEHELEAGDVFFGDAGVLVMPVRDSSSTFVWLTCATLLRNAERIGLAFGAPQGPSQSRLLEQHVWLKSLQSGPAGLCDRIAAITGHPREFVAPRLFCVADNEFRWAAEFATQVDVRNRIDFETGVVRDGALWSEESLAPETVLVAPIGHRNATGAEAMRSLSALSVLTLGGKNTIGRGVCRVMLEEIHA
jgi:CRISPR-associated protein Cmr4